MGHLQREIVTYGSVWLAMLAMVVATVYFLRAKRRDRRALFVDGVELHAHVDVIHVHRHGDVAHLHDAAGQPVAIRH